MDERAKRAVRLLGLAVEEVESQRSTVACETALASEVVKLAQRLDVVRRETAYLLEEERPQQAVQFTGVEQLKQAFERVDVNGDGQLDATELQSVFSACGREYITEAMILDFIDAFDSDGNQQLSFNEFVRVWNCTSTHPMLRAAIRDGVHELAGRDDKSHDKPKKAVVVASPYVLHPAAPVNADWELCMTILLCVTVVLLPLSLAFDKLGCKLKVANLIIDAGFIADIIKHFFTGFTDGDGTVILSRVKIASHYLKRGFLLDLVSSFPFDMVNLSFQCSSDDLRVARATKLLKLIRLCRIMKIFRLLRVSKTLTKVRVLIMHIEDKYKVSVPESAIKMGQLLLLLLLGAHWIGCFQWFVAAEQAEGDKNKSRHWPMGSWVRAARLGSSPIWKQYAWSYYKALSQMILIGFEVPSAVNQSCTTISKWCGVEHWITLACLYLGALFYSLLISNVSMILVSTNLSARQYRDALQLLNEYLRAKAVPASLRDRVKDYYTLQHAEGTLFDETKILNMVTPDLKAEILLHTTRDLVAKVPLLSACGNDIIKALVVHIRCRVALDAERIVVEATPGDDLFFISSGIFDIVLKGVLVETIADGCYFGDCSALLGCPRTATVVSAGPAVLYSLTRRDLQLSLNDHADVLSYLRLVAESRYERMQHYGADAEDDSIGHCADNLLLDDQEDVKTEVYRECLRQHMEEEARLGADDDDAMPPDEDAPPQEPQQQQQLIQQQRPSAVQRLLASLAATNDTPPSRKVYVAHEDSSPTNSGRHRRSSVTARDTSRNRRVTNVTGKFKAPDKALPSHIARVRARQAKQDLQFPDPERPHLFHRTLKLKVRPLPANAPTVVTEPCLVTPTDLLDK